jgi:hypothetical protein
MAHMLVSSANNLCGHWVRYGDGAHIGCIRGERLTWASGESCVIKHSSSRTIEFESEGVVYKGALTTDGLLHWDDGDVWARTSADVAVSRLVAAHQGITFENNTLDLKSEAGRSACAQLLDTLNVAVWSLELDIAPRTYWTQFTANYQMFFRNATQTYRMEILDGAEDCGQHAYVWVNGEQFTLGDEVRHDALALQRALITLGDCLLHKASAIENPSYSELRSALLAFDLAWAMFEHVYILGMINIEQKSRQLLVDAVKHEKRLELIENGARSDPMIDQLPEYREELRSLVTDVSRLSARVNVSSKGCDHLGAEILFSAYATLQRCGREDCSDDQDGALVAAQVLATDVVASFTAVRTYLREVGKCLAKVDPLLSKNAGLVTCLAAWCESWEVGARYLQNNPLLDALGDAAAHVRRAQMLVPELAAMCDNYDAELFLVLPRLIWLRFLVEPIAQTELLKTLLPHRFIGMADLTGEEQLRDADLADLVRKYHKVEHFFGSAQGQPPHSVTWQALVKRLVCRGDVDDENDYEDISPSIRKDAQLAVGDLLRDLERWSMELQRHCPEDWNHYSATLLHCLTCGCLEPTPEPFRI